MVSPVTATTQFLVLTYVLFFYLMCMNGLPACAFLMPLEGVWSEDGVDNLGLELQIVMSYHVVAGN